MAALDAGYDVKASGVTLDRFCGSGITSTNIAAGAIMAGMEDLVIAGGTEMMSMTAKRACCRWTPATPACATSPPPAPPGRVRRRHRHAGGHPARRARRAGRWKARLAPPVAIEEGRFDKSLVPVFKADGTLALDHEEFPRPRPPPRPGQAEALLRALADYPAG
jgi:acetyl-CoA C-acetyltransferase